MVVLPNRVQPARGRKTENERAQFKKRCTLARGVKAKGCKKCAVKQGILV